MNTLIYEAKKMENEEVIRGDYCEGFIIEKVELIEKKEFSK